jgi:excisionase family DNA binding protein
MANLDLVPIVRTACHNPVSGPASSLCSKPGIPAFVATFGNGDILFLRDVAEVPMPAEATNFFQTAALQDSVGRLLRSAKRTETHLEKTRTAIHQASKAAAPSKSPPDYFTSLDQAAKYAGVTKRTISNWKRRGWLKVEQTGRKIRIARAELLKCKLKQ